MSPGPPDQSSQAGAAATLLRIRLVLGLFIFALILSGVTAFPLQREVEGLASALGVDHSPAGGSHGGLEHWLLKVRDGLRETYARHPWIAYGTDWLAFAHITIALFFIGPLINPVRNVWVLQAGLVACALIIPLALICGLIRQIPLGWRFIDCSFGLVGAIPLVYCLRLTRKLERNRV
jgi:hypothetical protein